MTVKLLDDEVLSATAKKRDPTKYRWYRLEKSKAKFDSAHKTFDLELRKGEKFGLKFYRGSYFLVDEDDLSVQFKLSVEEGKKLIGASKPFSGKVAGKKVEGGEDNARSKPDAGPSQDMKGFSFLVQQKGGKFETGRGYKTAQAAQRAASKLIGPRTTKASISTVKGEGKDASLVHVKEYIDGRWVKALEKEEQRSKLDKLEDEYERLEARLDSIDVDTPSGAKKYASLKKKLRKLREQIQQALV